ncbi:hypothetical protein C6503_01765 [Candidatus Poribacteria bacterium]|nr:MAG: hypothetical protein C6503_01765 [Candidatus Poribacteria bacterium]
MKKCAECAEIRRNTQAIRRNPQKHPSKNTQAKTPQANKLGTMLGTTNFESPSPYVRSVRCYTATFISLCITRLIDFWEKK